MKQKTFSEHFKLSKRTKKKLINNEKKAIKDYHKAGLHHLEKGEKEDLKEVKKIPTK